MEKLLIKGGNQLSGKITCSGAKNAALPMIASTILSDEKVTLRNLPYLQDITTMFELLGSMGSDIILDENMNFTIYSKDLKYTEARYELPSIFPQDILKQQEIHLTRQNYTIAEFTQPSWKCFGKMQDQI